MTDAPKATKSRKPAAKPARRVHLYNANSNPMLVELTVGAETFDYFVARVRADYGMGFEFRKLVHGEPSDETYHVHYDPARRLSTCDCKGGSYNGHCKHQEAIVALIQSGKIDVPEAAPKQPEATPAAAEDHGEQFASLTEWEKQLILRSAKSEREIRAMARNFIAQNETPFEDL